MISMNIHDLVNGDDPVASLPEIFYRLKEAIDDPDSSYKEMGEIIAYDPGLTARLLKIVNSAFFGFPNRIETIPHAISIVGMDQLNDLVLSTTVIGQFKHIPSDLMSMKAFWEHSIACGLAARIIASQRKDSNPERFFVAGLMHDIGRLVICLKAPERAREAILLSKSQNQALHQAELELMGFDHAQVGALLLKIWGLPQAHAAAVEFHHNPTQSTRFPLEAAIVHAADIIINTLKLGWNQENLTFSSMDAGAWEQIQIPEDSLFTNILNIVIEEYEQTARIFLQEA